jgi:hypothetical protein
MHCPLPGVCGILQGFFVSSGPRPDAVRVCIRPN